MCNNAMTYNHQDTIYYKAARKLLHYGVRTLSEERIIALKPLLPYMEEVRSDQLGFEFPCDDENDVTEVPVPEPELEIKRDEVKEVVEKPKEPKKPREMPKYVPVVIWEGSWNCLHKKSNCFSTYQCKSAMGHHRLIGIACVWLALRTLILP